MKLSSVMSVLSDLAYAYPNTKLPTDQAGQEGIARVWHAVLGELDEQYVQEAVKQWVMTEQWFPAPAQIRKVAIQRQTGLMAPSQAWNAVVTMVESRDSSVWKATHTIAKQALRDIGGPHTITASTDLTWVRDRYLKAYDERVQGVYIDPKESVQIGIPGGKAHALTGGQE